MIELSELSTEELEYMLSKWTSEKTELEKQKAQRAERLDTRLNVQTEDAAVQATREADLSHAQGVLTALVNAGEAQAMIDEQQAVVDELQAIVDGYGLSSSYISHTDARIIQMDLDELEFSISHRGTRISEIEALLA